ncbi:MAG: DNA (cytosine-5-)-methyltransferase, partial [Proteobacteria bacterium]|nr:DNA (cytosine-5-)-methyltransferase [Pseudomonadota bacterium]
MKGVATAEKRHKTAASTSVASPSYPARIRPQFSRSQSNRRPRLETFIDLFCGIGGFHFAAAELGLRCVFASDIDAEAAKQYEHCHGVPVHGDIRAIKVADIPEHQILFAGFPCQPFSIIGSMDGIKDERGVLFHEILRILSHRRPRAVVLENVEQFSTINGGRTIKDLVSALRS